MGPNTRSKKPKGDGSEEDPKPANRPQSRPRKTKPPPLPTKSSEKNEEADTPDQMQTDQSPEQPIASDGSSAAKKPNQAKTSRATTRSQAKGKSDTSASNANDADKGEIATSAESGKSARSAENAANADNADNTERATALPSRPYSRSPPNEPASDESNLAEPTIIDPWTDPNVNTPFSPVDSSGPEHCYIVPDGDLTLELCKDFTVSVSSAVLSQASPRLSTSIKRWLIKPANPSSPSIRKLHEEEHYAMYRLLVLLHSRPDPMAHSHPRLIDVKDEDLKDVLLRSTDPLLHLAILVDKYECHEALNLVSETLLSDFAFPSARDAVDFSQAVQIAAAAYLLQQPRYFRLFTKRLVTDHTEALTTLELPFQIPSKQSFLIRTELEKQSSESYAYISERIQLYSSDTCGKNGSDCKYPQPTDALFLKRLTDSVLTPDDKWPAERSEEITLRHLLHGLYHLERLQRVLWCVHDRVRTYGSVDPEEFVRLCIRIDGLYLPGACLVCTRAGHECDCLSSVEYANAARWVAKDSFMFGAGPAYRDRSEYGLTGRE
jgi:hypothetical protein